MTSNRMARTSGQNNPFEQAVRSGLHDQGLRFRIHYPVPNYPRRTIDIAFTRLRIAIFLDGCFWHGCPAHGTSPKRNAEFWASKIQLNKERDLLTDTLLKNGGWRVLRIWEHEGAEAAIDRIHSLILRHRQTFLQGVTLALPEEQERRAEFR